MIADRSIKALKKSQKDVKSNEKEAEISGAAVSEVHADTMITENSVEASGKSQARAQDHGKGIGKCTTVVDSVPVEELKQPKFDGDIMLVDSSTRVGESGAVVLDSLQVEDSNRTKVNVDTMIFYCYPANALKQSHSTVKDHQKEVKKPLKRKRASIDENVICQDKATMVTECRRELDGLFEFYKEFSSQKLHLEGSIYSSNNNTVIACLLEESHLPFSKLVEEIYQTLKAKEGVTLVSVRRAVLSVGQRSMYGITNPDADVLEDESEPCLWCWETRDMKLFSKTQRGILNIRRMARKRIHERVSALSEMLSALSVPECHDSYKSDLMKASVKLGKVLNGEGIRSLIEKLEQKNDTDVTVKGAKLKEKELIKEMERSKRNAEKKKKSMDREIQKEKCQSEKELRLLQEETEKEERRREKEEAELKKQLKKQQEEAERDQRRREKEEAELKKQLALRKQATIMERFLKSKKSNNNSDKPEQGSSSKGPMSDPSCKNKDIVNATTSAMDCAFSQQDYLTTENLRKSHVAGWHKLSHCNRSCRWGVRRNPKVELIKELKLQQSSSESEPPKKFTPPKKGLATSQVNCNIEPSLDRLVDGLQECFMSSLNHLDTASPSGRLLNRKLLQFDKSHRPAFYGTLNKKRGVVGPRHPFKKDPDLDYDVDSDEEWEEEDPGESLSDCDKDIEECLEEENLKIEDEDESEDSFVVPDGYLSENEGVQVECSSECIEDEARSSPCCNPEVESEKFIAFLRHQKCLHNLTNQALQNAQPLVISNLMHEKGELMMAEDLNGTSKLEQICLQALCMRACPGGSVIGISINQNPSNEDQEVCQSQSRTGTTSTAAAAAIPDSDLPEFVRSIRSNPHGINKVVELLQCKFPTIPRSQLRNKVREISDFVDNRWQVKKEVLSRLGFSPDKGGRPKGIAMYFSKRCLPPEGEPVNIPESSPQPCSKTKVFHGDDGHNPETGV